MSKPFKVAGTRNCYYHDINCPAITGERCLKYGLWLGRWGFFANHNPKPVNYLKKLRRIKMTYDPNAPENFEIQTPPKPNRLEEAEAIMDDALEFIKLCHESLGHSSDTSLPAEIDSTSARIRRYNKAHRPTIKEEG